MCRREVANSATCRRSVTFKPVWACLQRISPVHLKWFLTNVAFFRVVGGKVSTLPRPEWTTLWLDAIILCVRVRACAFATEGTSLWEAHRHYISSESAAGVQWSPPPARSLDVCVATPAAQISRTAGGFEGGLGLRHSSTKSKKKLGQSIAVMSGQPRFVNPFHRPQCLAAAAPAGKAKLTHPGKAILAGKKVCARRGAC